MRHKFNPKHREHGDRRKGTRIIPDRIIKGEESEGLASLVLDDLLKRGVIAGFKQAPPGNPGWDFMVDLTPEVKIPLQIKSSRIGAREHEATWGSVVPCCVVMRPTALELLPMQERQLVINQMGDGIIDALQRHFLLAK